MPIYYCPSHLTPLTFRRRTLTVQVFIDKYGKSHNCVKLKRGIWVNCKHLRVS